MVYRDFGQCTGENCSPVQGYDSNRLAGISRTVGACSLDCVSISLDCGSMLSGLWEHALWTVGVCSVDYGSMLSVLLIILMIHLHQYKSFK